MQWGEGGGGGGVGAGFLPGIDKNEDNLNMNARKRATNRAKTATNSKTKTKTGVGGKGGGLAANTRWASDLLVGRQFDIYVDLEGGSADKNSPGQDKLAFEAKHHSPTNQIPEGKKNQLPKKKRKICRRIKNIPPASSQ